MGDKLKLDCSDSCESRKFFQTAVFSHNTESVRIKPRKTPEILERDEVAPQHSILRVPLIPGHEPRREEKQGNPCKQYQLTYLKASDFHLYLSPILRKNIKRLFD